MAVRTRDLGIRIGTGTPGRWNAITDVPGVRVGHHTLVEGDAVRTGVTIVEPSGCAGGTTGVYAGLHTLNGNGEVTGAHWIVESGLLTSPIGLTNTNSVGVVRDGLSRHQQRTQAFWPLPVVGETWDGVLNDIAGFHITTEHVEAALAALSDGPVDEGAVGGGTGMICHGFKGGIGTASRVTPDGHTVGVLVQSNHGRRPRLAVNGAPVGLHIPAGEVPVPTPADGPRPPEGAGSIIVVVATDAPLLPHQLNRVAQRGALGIGRVGGAGENSSGDFVLAFSVAATLDPENPAERTVRSMSEAAIDPVFHAVIEATEEAIVNSMVAATSVTGKGGVTAHAIDHERLVAVLDRYGLRELPTT